MFSSTDVMYSKYCKVLCVAMDACCTIIPEFRKILDNSTQPHLYCIGFQWTRIMAHHIIRKERNKRKKEIPCVSSSSLADASEGTMLMLLFQRTGDDVILLTD